MEALNQPSVFADLVDRLRYKSEEELKRLYAIFFREDLENEWKQISFKGNFSEVSEEDIISAIQKKRYSPKNA